MPAVEPNRQPVGQYVLACPECQSRLPVQVEVEIPEPDENGFQYPIFHSDHVDIWAHLLVCGGGGEPGRG